MNRLFILGAGFSKAISSHMPLLWELGEFARDWCQNTPYASLTSGFRDDFEALLTYLYQPMPWKSQEEASSNLAAYHSISGKIANYIGQCEINAFDYAIPDWSTRFAEYLCRNEVTVVSLNYDTIMERLLTQQNCPGKTLKVNERGLYSLPLTHVGVRSGSYDMTFHQADCWLLKIHGSINWFVADDAWSHGGQVYFCKVDELQSPNKELGTQDLIPLIIPPVADKSSFYQSGLVRTMWRAYRDAFNRADEVYCVGYSLPRTDFTMRLFFGGVDPRPGRRIYLVNKATGEVAKDLLRNYRETFPSETIMDCFMVGENAVESMVNHVIETEPS